MSASIHTQEKPKQSQLISQSLMYTYKWNWGEAVCMIFHTRSYKANNGVTILDHFLLTNTIPVLCLWDVPPQHYHIICVCIDEQTENHTWWWTNRNSQTKPELRGVFVGFFSPPNCNEDVSSQKICFHDPPPPPKKKVFYSKIE